MGWLNGLTCLVVVLSFLISGLFFIYKSKKTNAKLLSYMGLGIIFNGLFWLGGIIDFLTIITTGNNLNPVYLFVIFGRMWVGLSMVGWFYLASELLMPKRKKIIVIVYGILAIIFELFLIFDTQNNYNINIPVNPGENILDSNNVILSPNSIIMLFYQITALIFFVFGLLYKSFQSKGVLRKKYRYLSIGFFIFIICSFYDAIFSRGGSYFLVIVRIVIISCIPFLYLGLREEPEKKISAEKEVKIKDSLFRITKRPDHITEEEVNFHRERKICLVCKGNVSGISYICPSCDALYCIKCSEELSDLENMCWVCNEPFDDSKPIKPFRREEEGEIQKKLKRK